MRSTRAHGVRVLVARALLLAVAATSVAYVGYVVSRPPEVVASSERLQLPTIDDVAVLGDGSQAAGADPDDSWVARLGAATGWRVEDLSSPGSGFLLSSDNRSEDDQVPCDPNACPPVEDALDDVTGSPDLVLVSAGAADVGGSADDVAAAVSRLFDDAAEAYPDARLVATSPVWSSGEEPPDSLATVAVDVEDAVEEAGGLYLDLGDPLVVATGTDDTDTPTTAADPESVLDLVLQQLRTRGLLAPTPAGG